MPAFDSVGWNNRVPRRRSALYAGGGAANGLPVANRGLPEVETLRRADGNGRDRGDAAALRRLALTR